MILVLVIFSGIFHQTDCRAQRSSGLQPATGLHRAPGLHKAAGLDTAKGLDSSVKLDSQSSTFSYREPQPPPREIFPSVHRVPILPNNTPQLYARAKLAINKAGTPSIFRKNAVGVLVGIEHKIQSEGPFVMEYTGYLENGEAAYFVPQGMTDPIKIQKYQILSYLAYPPYHVLDKRTPENIEWMEEWIGYAEKKIKRQSLARQYFKNLLREAREYLENDEAEVSDTPPSKVDASIFLPD
jgi:hypothetical protein